MRRRVTLNDWGGIVYGRHAGEVLEATPDEDGRWSVYPQRHPSRLLYRWMTKRQAIRAIKQHFQEGDR